MCNNNRINQCDDCFIAVAENKYNYNNFDKKYHINNIEILISILQDVLINKTNKGGRI